MECGWPAPTGCLGWQPRANDDSGDGVDVRLLLCEAPAAANGNVGRFVDPPEPLGAAGIGFVSVAEYGDAVLAGGAGSQDGAIHDGDDVMSSPPLRSLPLSAISTADGARKPTPAWSRSIDRAKVLFALLFKGQTLVLEHRRPATLSIGFGCLPRARQRCRFLGALRIIVLACDRPDWSHSFVSRDVCAQRTKQARRVRVICLSV